MMRWQKQTNSAKTHDVTRKWWLYPSLAAIVFTGMTLTGTTAQAATDDQSATATTGTETPVATQTIQEQRVTIGQTAPDTASTDVTPENESGTGTPEVQEPETPEVQESETQEPDAQAPDTQTPDTPDASTNGVTGESKNNEVGTEATNDQQSAPASQDGKLDSVDLKKADDITNESAKTESMLKTAKLTRDSSEKVTTKSADEEELDSRFEDQNLLASVRKGFGLKDGQALTQKVIQSYIGNNVSIGNYTPSAGDVVRSFAGMEVLRDFPGVRGITLMVQLGTTKADVEAIDLTPLAQLSFRTLNLYTNYWGAMSDANVRVISQLDPSNVYSLNFSAQDQDTVRFDGMNNRQFEMLAPFFKAAIENERSAQMISLSGNNITDFSALSKDTLTPNESSQITSWYQYEQKETPIVYQQGDTVTVTSPITGACGESFNFRVRYYQEDGSLVVAQSQAVTVMDANGNPTTVYQYKLVNPKIMDYNGQKQIVYGNFSYADAGRTTYAGMSFVLTTGVLVFQPIGEATSTATVTYVDDTTGETLATQDLSGNVGTTIDYQTAPMIQNYQKQGYELVSDDYPVDPKYTAEAQQFKVHLKHSLETLNNSKSVTQLIQYKYVDGTTAAPTYQAWVTFVRKGSRDKVTGKTTWEAWHPTSETADLPAKTSPLIPGFTADQAEVPAVRGLTATSGDQLTVVTYMADGGTVTPPIVPPVEPPVTPEVPDEGGNGDTGTPETPAPTPEPEQPATGGDAATGTTDETKPQQPGSPVIGGQAATVAGRPGKSLETPLAAKTFGTTPKIASQSATTLPQTNEQRTSSWTLLGALGLALAGVVGIRRRKDEK